VTHSPARYRANKGPDRNASASGKSLDCYSVMRRAYREAVQQKPYSAAFIIQKPLLAAAVRAKGRLFGQQTLVVLSLRMRQRHCTAIGVHRGEGERRCAMGLTVLPSSAGQCTFGLIGFDLVSSAGCLINFRIGASFRSPVQRDALTIARPTAFTPRLPKWAFIAAGPCSLLIYDDACVRTCGRRRHSACVASGSCVIVSTPGRDIAFPA